MTQDLSVVGGIYRERCLRPEWNRVFGSAGRAAQAVSSLAPGLKKLFGYIGEREMDEAGILATLTDFELHATPLPFSVTFDYAHTLADPIISPSPGLMEEQPPIQVSGDTVLRYGMLEGDAIVRAEKAVYDPQSAFDGVGFTANGSTAGRLAVVLNRLEMRNITGESDPQSGAAWFFEHDNAEIVVLKMGAMGARLFSRDASFHVPLYRSSKVWKLGSGDVFSSTFAALWAVQGMPPERAADLASRSVAWYCENRSLPPPSPAVLEEIVIEAHNPGRGKIYLAGPFFDLGQRWVIEEARRALLHTGVEVFSPYHEIGPGKAEEVAPADLDGLESCHAVLAIVSGMDPGTIFEVGYAKRLGIPVVALAENVREEDLKMIVGTGAVVTDDFVTAIYQAVWSLRP